jgi:hypothetical protein
MSLDALFLLLPRTDTHLHTIGERNETQREKNGKIITVDEEIAVDGGVGKEIQSA